MGMGMIQWEKGGIRMGVYCQYPSPLGPMILAVDGEGLCGVWFVGQRYFPRENLGKMDATHPVLCRARQWLDAYFSGEVPQDPLPLHLKGTDFQRSVWQALMQIPYGKTVTYGQLAKKLGVGSAQAVGGAVGRNPVSILIPCHRVLGADGSLTGYAGGLERKQALLEWEKAL